MHNLSSSSEHVSGTSENSLILAEELTSNNKPLLEDDKQEILNPIRRIVAGKKITALFEETLVEGLQKSRKTTASNRESSFYRDDSVDV